MIFQGKKEAQIPVKNKTLSQGVVAPLPLGD